MRRSDLLKLAPLDEEVFKVRMKTGLLPLELGEVDPGKSRDYDIEDALELCSGNALIAAGLSVGDAQSAVFNTSRHEMEHWWPMIIEPSAPPVFLGVVHFIPDKGRDAGKEIKAQFLGPIGAHAGLTRTTNKCTLEELLPFIQRCSMINVSAVVGHLRERAQQHGFNHDIDAMYAVPPGTSNAYHDENDRKARDGIIAKAKRGARK